MLEPHQQIHALACHSQFILTQWKFSLPLWPTYRHLFSYILMTSKYRCNRYGVPKLYFLRFEAWVWVWVRLFPKRDPGNFLRPVCVGWVCFVACVVSSSLLSKTCCVREDFLFLPVLVFSVCWVAVSFFFETYTWALYMGLVLKNIARLQLAFIAEVAACWNKSVSLKAVYWALSVCM